MIHRLNKNKLAREVTLREGGKVNLPIAQVSEVMRLVFAVMQEQADAASNPKAMRMTPGAGTAEAIILNTVRSVKPGKERDAL